MKKTLAILSIVVLSNCQQEQAKDYVTLNGKITNPHESLTIKIFKNDFEKIIQMNNDGSFNDTLKIVEDVYRFKHGDEYGNMYLKNNNTTSFTTDYEDFDKKLIFEGDASDNNNLSIQTYLLGGNFFTAELFNDLNKEDIDKAVADYKTALKSLKMQYKDADSLHLANADKDAERTITSTTRYLESKIALLKEFPKGAPSPIFENYENHKGGTTSLTDLKGNYVYVDVWATWCGPCKREIPSLKKIEEQYHNKNIAFVSISVDDARRSGSDEAAHQAWNKMVTEKELGGIQLFSDKAWQSDFIQAYKITGIPRFILIDPDGKVVSPDAPRPSNPKLIELFESLDI